MALTLLVSGHGGHALVPGMDSMVMTVHAAPAASVDHHGVAERAMAAVASYDALDPDYGSQPGFDSCASVICGMVSLDGAAFSPRSTMVRPLRPLRHVILTGQVAATLSPAPPKRPPRG